MNSQIFFGEQQTEAWHQLRLGLFTSSTIYHLFEDSSKQAKATALIQQLKDGIWKPNEKVYNHRPSSDDLTYMAKYLVDYKFIKKLDVVFIKKDVKDLNDELYSELLQATHRLCKEWCKERDKRYNQWHKERAEETLITLLKTNFRKWQPAQ